jgi:aconitate decarboxylase
MQQVRSCIEDLYATTMLIRYPDGTKTFEKHIEHALGSSEVAMTDEQLEKKFIDQAELVIGESAQAASDACWKLEDMDDVSQLIAQL